MISEETSPTEDQIIESVATIATTTPRPTMHLSGNFCDDSAGS